MFEEDTDRASIIVSYKEKELFGKVGRVYSFSWKGSRFRTAYIHRNLYEEAKVWIPFKVIIVDTWYDSSRYVLARADGVSWFSAQFYLWRARLTRFIAVPRHKFLLTLYVWDILDLEPGKMVEWNDLVPYRKLKGWFKKNVRIGKR